MATNRLKMDAINLVAASRAGDDQLVNSIMGGYEHHADLARECANVAALLAGSGAATRAIAGYLAYVEVNGKIRNARSNTAED